MQDMVDKGRSTFGIRSHNAKLSMSDVKRVFALRKQGRLLREIAAEFGISMQAISLILQCKRYVRSEEVLQ